MVSSLIVYGSVGDANTYFTTRLNTQAWTCASDADKLAAISMATRAIDRLNYIGDPTDPNQPNQFPRGGDVTVPDDIVIATYECAISFLDGIDPDVEVENLQTSHQMMDDARVTYERSFVLEHLRAGIPSNTAWNYIKPYLRNPGTISFSRVN